MQPLRRSYTLIAPLYDLLLANASRGARQRSLAQLPAHPGRLLFNGVGTGLDLPLLSGLLQAAGSTGDTAGEWVGTDLTAAMLQRSLQASRNLPHGPLAYRAIQADAQQLPFADATFDHAVLHLILAVVPDPLRCLQETARVLRPGGSLLIFDKFLRPGQSAPLRRLLNPLARRLATRLDVVFEPLLAATPALVLEDDQAALAGGWFRQIRLRRTA